MSTTVTSALTVTPPYSAETEQGALGLMLVDAQALTDGVARLRRQDFYVEVHAVLFETMLQLHQQSRSVDLLTVTTKLRDKGTLESVGGSYYVACLPNAILPGVTIEVYAETLLRYTGKRALLTLGQSLQFGAVNGQEPDALIADAQARLDALACRTSLPTYRESVGSTVWEVGGDELAAAQLDAADLPTLPLLGEGGYVIKGWSHLFAGYPRCGKTELLIRQAQDWIAQGLTILYLTEEPKSIWQHRLGSLAGDWTPLRVVLGLGMDPNRLFKRAFTGSEEVVVVDTLRNLLGLEDETDNSEVAKRLNPWVAEARNKNKTLIMAHHMRKGAGEHGEGIAGGHALLGVFDIALEVLRDPNQARRRLIRPYARLISPAELVYELREDGQFVALGDPGALRLEEVSQRVQSVLTAEWQKTREVQESLTEPRPSLEQVRQALTTLARDGKVDRDPPITDGDAQGKAHRWRLPTSLPTDFPMVGSTV